MNSFDIALYRNERLYAVDRWYDQRVVRITEIKKKV